MSLIDFTNILNDEQHGSTRITEDYLNLIRTGSFTKDEVKHMCALICERFAEMSVLDNICSKLIEADDLIGTSQQLLNSIKESDKRIYKNFKQYIENGIRIMTISNSRTIFSLLCSIARQHIIENIILSDGIPFNDGLVFSNNLRKNGLNVEVIPDLSYGSYIDQVDFVVCGADAYNNDYFVNRTGTLSLVLMANYYNIPFYVVTSTLKECSNDYLSNCESRQKKLIKDDKYPLFEKIPRNLVTEFVTDKK